MMNRPVIHADFTGVNSLEQPGCVATVTGSQLRAGMVVLDDVLGTPAVGLDHRVRATPKSGAVAFLVNDFDGGGWRHMEFHARSAFKVVAHRRPSATSK
jgi:hypothetical protein